MTEHTAWPQTLASLHSAGRQAGRDAADQWARTNLGRRVLARRGTGSRSTTVGLPFLGGAGRRLTGASYRAAAADGQPPWDQLTSTQRDEALTEHSAGFDRGVEERMRVHRQASPAVRPWRILPHLHPDRLRQGTAGVFAGSWAWQTTAFGQHRIPVGFAGILVETDIDGRAVFTCTRQVAEAIVADQQRLRAFWRNELIELGAPGELAAQAVEHALAEARFHGDLLVIDETTVDDAAATVTTMTPNDDGEYVVMGGAWDWRAIDPHDCDRIIGEVPVPAERQRFVVLPHAPGIQVPHLRFRLRLLRQWPARSGLAFVAALLLDGHRIGTVGDDATGSGADLLLSDPTGAAAWTAYVAASRYCGRYVDRQRLLDALTDQMLLTVAVAAEAAVGNTLLRLLADDGKTKALHPIPTRQPWPDIEKALAEHTGGGQWRLWTGRTWAALPDVSAAATPDGR